MTSYAGDTIASAVKQALERVGFKDVEDADVEASDRNRREDFRVHDRSPLLLVEAKGVSGLPSEADALQVVKYIAPRMRELKRTDIRGIAIINHQRNLPALQRQNDQPFQQDVLVNAAEQNLGLMTGWDFFRLLRGVTDLGWTADEVLDLFYRDGRIEPVPGHYGYAGVIDGFWPQAQAFGLRLESGAAVRVGDQLAYELPAAFREEVVTSIQLNSAAIDLAKPGSYVGIATELDAAAARDGTRVFVVRPERAVVDIDTKVGA
jgi:hypothetical protein